MPERIQLRRTKDWRLPLNAKHVARPSRWGNPARVVRRGGTWDVVGPGASEIAVRISRRDALQAAVDWYRSVADRPGRDGDLQRALIRAELAGFDLACWCKLGDPCHADVLLEIANGGES